MTAVSDAWSRYYAAAGDEPRRTLLDALERFAGEGKQSGRAVDLGCGAGRDTAELLRRGWHVVAIDAEAEAIERLRGRGDLGDGALDRLETSVARYGEARWSDADLVNSSFALPFCPPHEFAQIWSRITNSLARGGRFCGQLFGDRDGWAPADDMSFQTRYGAEQLLEPFDVERFEEVEEDGRTALGEPKHWHVFHIVARKR